MKSSPNKLSRAYPEHPGQGERLQAPPATVTVPALPDKNNARLMQEEPDTLSRRELEYYLFIVESSLQVRKSHQFFLWAQGQLQSLFPHEILFCVHGDLHRRDFTVSRYTSAPFPDDQFTEICHPESGLVAKVIQTWQRSWEEPCLFAGENGRVGLHPQVELLMEQHRLPNLACHGTHAVNGGASTCFIFARLPQPLGSRQCYLLKLLLPHLHAAFVRTLIDGRREQRLPVAPTVLTGREIEILQWVSEGKSNHQIGDALRISPLTVKNHVQNILKKLEVQNRTQAVSRAISLRLIGSGSNAAG